MKSLLTTTRVATLALGLAISAPALSHAQKDYKPTKENLAAREQFRNRGFGIFLHWGLYSMFAQGECGKPQVCIQNETKTAIRSLIKPVTKTNIVD